MDPATLTIISTVISGLGSIAQGNAAADSAKYNAQVQSNNAQIALQNATLAGQKGAANAAIEQQKTRATVGAIKAAQAANGIDLSSGSAVDVRSSAAELGQLNAITVRSNAAREAYGYQTQSSSHMAQSQLDRQEAKYDAASGYLEAGGTLLGNTTKAAKSGTFDSWLGKSSINGDSFMGPSQLPWQNEPGYITPNY